MRPRSNTNTSTTNSEYTDNDNQGTEPSQCAAVQVRAIFPAPASDTAL